MKPEKFIKSLKNEVVDNSVSFYKQTLDTTNVEDANDKYWIELLKFYKNLSGKDKILLLSIIREVSIDSIATMLGALDGVSTLDGIGCDYVLEAEGKKINGNLLELFLELTEKE